MCEREREFRKFSEVDTVSFSARAFLCFRSASLA